MKKVLIIVVTLVTIYSCGSIKSTTFPAADFSSEKVIENLNQPQTKLFVSANDWMVDTFNDAESVIQFTDKEEGTVIGKYLLQGKLFMTAYSQLDSRIYAKITIQLKDNRAKIKVIPTTAITIYRNEEILAIKGKINNLISNFETSIKNSNSNNW
ncbi:MAG: hypothetical protein COB01_03040 [Lutibacter sp.]|nr:MAG: hypothetical protein COB01_03040 [Lutibacter sp.]